MNIEASPIPASPASRSEISHVPVPPLDIPHHANGIVGGRRRAGGGLQVSRPLAPRLQLTGSVTVSSPPGRAAGELGLVITALPWPAADREAHTRPQF